MVQIKPLVLETIKLFVDFLEEGLAFARIHSVAEIAVIVAYRKETVDELLGFFRVFWMVVGFFVVATHAGFCN